MSQVNKTPLAAFVLLSLLVFLLAGCGDTNTKSDFDQNTGAHSSGWIPAGHMTAAKANVQTCADCHGSDYGGGIAKIACTKCHLGNQNSIHPTQWGNNVAVLHGDYVKLNGTNGCANVNCHGAKLDGVGGAGPSCTQCHIGGALSFHPAAWGNLTYVLHADYAKVNGATGCANIKCHGANLDGVGGTGPSCTQCHIGGPLSFHPVAWKTNIVLHRDYVRTNGDSSCRNITCHGANLQGVLLSGPGCQVCHP